jgi:hypothetical protein
VKQRILRWIVMGLLAGERLWAFILCLVALAAVSLVPMALAGWINPIAALVLSWVAAVACALAAHVYRGRAMLWEALCRKAQRESGEFFEGLLGGHTLAIGVTPPTDGKERMPN